LSVISVNALKPVTARATGARAYMHTLAVTVADAPRHAGLAHRDPPRRARFAHRLLGCAGWIWRELGSPDMVGYRD
jgi:hypothetical protein